MDILRTISTAHFASQIEYLDPADRSLFRRPEPQFNLLVVGTGMIGREHIRVTYLEGRADIKGLYDTSSRSLTEALRMIEDLRPGAEVRTYPSLSEACNDPEIDGIIICTPNYTHLEVLKTAVQSGKPILLEKPMATTLTDAQEILRLSAEYPSFIQVGLQYRYKAIYRTAYDNLVGLRRIGELKTISISEHRIEFLDKVSQWNKFSRYSGGTLVEKCCHYFDLFNYFSGSKPTAVTAVGRRDTNYREFQRDGEKADILDSAFVTVEYENGIHANFSLCMFAPMFHEEITLCGSAGRIHAFETDDFLPGSGLETGFELRTTDGHPAVTSQLHYPAVIESSGHSGATFFEHSDFVERMLGHETQSATVEEGYWSVVVGVAAETAVREGRKVYIDELIG
ncbi:MAG: Gfo/Idh/MocA family protein [Alkalispirochaeta sp.]